MNAIKEVRKYKRMTQKELAKAIGISESYLSEIENSKVYPSIKVFINISKTLNIHPCILMCNELGQPFPVCAQCQIKHKLKDIPLLIRKLQEGKLKIDVKIELLD